MDANTLALIIALIAAAPGVYAVWQQRKKIPLETSGLSADTAAKYQEIARKSAERVDMMQTRLDLLETQVQALELQLRQANERAGRFEDWARRLTHQVRSLGGVPVELEPTRPTP